MSIRFEDRRTPAFWTLLVLNSLAFAALVIAGGGFSIPPRLIAEWGGILPLDWMEGEYWRFLSAGFLHFSPLHLATNMLCLMVWGVPLERLFGTWRFAVLFVVSIIAGSITSVMMHEGPFVGAGASGGVSGLLGALLALKLLRGADMPASFFVINLGLNVAIALFAPGVDWQAHLGGFVAGFALAAGLSFKR